MGQSFRHVPVQTQPLASAGMEFLTAWQPEVESSSSQAMGPSFRHVPVQTRPLASAGVCAKI